MNACGTCTLCCKILGVREIGKPENRWCQHCDKGRGCTIYDARPQDCRSFRCVWLETQDRADALPANHRPDRCHVVFWTMRDGKTIVADVDPGYPGAWRGPVMERFIGEIRRHLPVIVKIGRRQILLTKKPAGAGPAGG